MTSINRIKQKFLELNPMHKEQFVVPPDWVVAVAAVMDEQDKQIARLKARSRKPEE